MKMRNPIARVLIVLSAGLFVQPAWASSDDLAPRGPLDVDSKVLETHINDPMHPETVRIVMGCRWADCVDENTIQMVFGCNFNPQEVSHSGVHGFEIFSPDDPAYAFEKFVKAKALKTSTAPDVVAFEGALGKWIRIHKVLITLPAPMQEGKTYHVRAIGGRPHGKKSWNYFKKGCFGNPITSCNNAAKVIFGKPCVMPKPSEAVIKAVMGLRGVEVVGAKVLKLTFGHCTHPGSDAAQYAVSSSNDPAYKGGKAVLRMGRKSFPQHTHPSGGYPKKTHFKAHDVFVELPSALLPGKAYEVAVADAVTTGNRKISFTYTDLGMRNPHLKVNQCGYLPDSPIKWGFLGGWGGSFGAVRYEGIKAFHVVEVGTGKKVFTGTPKIRLKAGHRDGGLYNEILAGEEVHVLDFSEFDTPGEYYLVVPGNGRSYRFHIAKDVYREPFQVAMRGVFFQRCGQKMEPPHSPWRRIACHHQPIEFSTLSHFKGFPGGKAIDKSIPKRKVVGGHHDAGDYLPRSHYEVAEYLMRVYEMWPNKFYDGQLNVTASEKKNGLPDILDEAYWALQLYEQLQNEDGGTCMVVESMGDPVFVETPERDGLRQAATKPEGGATMIWAALAAQASRLWKQNGKNEKAADFLKRAVKAYEWAKSKNLKSGRQKRNWAWAASELLRTTGDGKYDQDFKTAGLNYHANDDKWRTAASYALNPRGDPELREQAKGKLLHTCRMWMNNAKGFGYPFFRHMEIPICWGNGAFPGQAGPLLVAYKLTGLKKYRRWMVHMADFTLGSNPMNLIHTTGIGKNYTRSAAHLWGWHNYLGRHMPGIQSEGPGCIPHSNVQWLKKDVFPTQKSWPILYNYFETKYELGITEGLVVNQVKTAAFYAAMLPEQEAAGGE